MNMKKTFAGAMAGALAVSAMATSASAAVPGPGEYTVDLTKDAEFYATVQFTFDADYMLDADATSLDLAINSTSDLVNVYGGIKELTVDVLGSTGTKTQTLKYNSTWNDVNFYDWYIGASMSIPVYYTGVASDMQALYVDKYTTVENALAVNAADGSKKLPKNVEFDKDGKYAIVDKYDLDFPYFDKIVVTAKIPCTKNFSLDELNGVGNFKTKVTASITGVHNINIYQIDDNKSDKVLAAEAKLEAFTKIFGTSNKSAAQDPADNNGVTGIVNPNGTVYAAYATYVQAETAAKAAAKLSGDAKTAADAAVTAAQTDVNTAYAALKAVDAKGVLADGSGAAADASQNVKVPAAGSNIEGAIVVKDATGAVTAVSTTVAYTDAACATKDTTVNAASPLALDGPVKDYVIALDALDTAKATAATAATKAATDATALTAATANVTTAKAAVLAQLKALGVVDDKGVVAKDYSDVIDANYIITVSPKGVDSAKFVKLYDDLKAIVDGSEGSFVGVTVSDSKTVAAETLFTKFEANKLGLKSGITIDNKVVKTVSGDLGAWKPDALRQIADAIGDNSGVTLTFTAKDNFDDAAYKSWIKYVSGVKGFDSWVGSGAWGTDSIKDSYDNWGVSMFTGAIVLNRDFSKQFSASGLVDWGTNSITFDWDELTEGRFYDASVVLHSLELLSTQNVEWLSCTVTVPEQEASADDADSSQGKDDDSTVIDDTPVESEVITEAPAETEAPATEAPATEAPAETTAVAPVDNVKTGNAPVALAVIPVALAAAAIIAKKRG